MDLDAIKKEWMNDCIIDESELSRASSNTPKLHAKYLDYLTQARFASRKAENKALEVKRVKTKYLKGFMTEEELNKYGWVQYQGPNILKGEMNDMIERDEDFIKVNNNYHYMQVVEEYLESVLKEIQNRNYHIKSCIEWQKWTNGDY